MTTGGEVRLTRDGHVGTITIDRPDKLNAMTVAMDREMNALVYEVNNDDAIRCLVLTGTGGRAFSAGSDLTDLDEYGTNWQYRNRTSRHEDYALGVWRIRKPIVAAIDGYCIGGGLEMACASDIRLASPNSSFAAGEIKWGWHGGSGATQHLTRAVGPGHASLLLLTGDRIDAEEALRIGLVQQLHPAEQVRERAHELATTIASRSPIATQSVKNLVRVAQSGHVETGLAYENDMFSYLMMTEDAAEGQRAFSEKRDPIFKGR
ncbi:MAG: enoyl-CoA hydratase/isomerase family protein [Nitriliruptoraceae bacterium]|nr:enoyl-CoA hydratase/isomerase family protein [Nitriliruptoraceae bacterium]